MELHNTLYKRKPLAEGSESLSEVSQEDLRDNTNFMTSMTVASLHVQFESATIIVKRSLLSNMGNYSDS